MAVITHLVEPSARLLFVKNIWRHCKRLSRCCSWILKVRFQPTQIAYFFRESKSLMFCYSIWQWFKYFLVHAVLSSFHLFQLILLIILIFYSNNSGSSRYVGLNNDISWYINWGFFFYVSYNFFHLLLGWGFGFLFFCRSCVSCWR